MKKKKYDLSAFAIALIIIGILFSACSIRSSVDPNEINTEANSKINETGTASNSIVEEEEIDPYILMDGVTTNPSHIPGSSFSSSDCFIAYDPKEEPALVEHFESYDCTPGYVYFEKRVFGEIKPLFETKVKYEFIAEFVESVYVVTVDNEVVKIKKETGKYETIYKSHYGTIDVMFFDHVESRYVFFSDDNHIIKLDPKSDKCTDITYSENGINKIYGGSGDFDKAGLFYCEECNEEYVVWEDWDENVYWYHPEADENEKVDWGELYYGHPIVYES